MTEKHLYKDLYIRKWIKVYRQKQASGDYCCYLEFALPFFYYVKFILAKPIRLTFSKNKLEHESNLLSRAAISRILKLLPRNKTHSPEYILILLKHKKYDLLNYMYNLAAFVAEDLKEYVNQYGFEEFCLKHTFDKKLFDNFYNAIIRSNAPIENWANLTTDNQNIADYAKNKLLKLREYRIKRLQSQYNFNLENVEDYWSNGKYWCIKRSFEYLGKAYSWQTIIDYQGKEIINFANKSVEDITPNEKVIFRNDEGKYGVKDLEGKSIIPAKYQLIERLLHHHTNEELFEICHNNKYGIIDEHANLYISCIYDELSEIQSKKGLFIAKKGKKYGIIDIKEQIRVPFNYTNIYTLGSYYFSAQISGKWGLYTYDNQEVISPQYNALYFYKNFGIAKHNHMWGIIDIKNNQITGFIFKEADITANDIKDIPLGYEYAIDTQGTKRYGAIMGCINKSTSIDVNVKQGKFWGTYSLTTGKQILPIKYSQIGHFYNDIAVVKIKGAQALVDRKNSIIEAYDNYIKYAGCPTDSLWRIKIRKEGYNYRHINNMKKDLSKTCFEMGYLPKEDIAAVSRHNHWGYMDNTGKIIVPIIFDEVGQFYNSQAMVAVNNKYCIIDTSSKQVNTDNVTLKLPKTLDNKDATKLFQKFLHKYQIILDKI